MHIPQSTFDHIRRNDPKLTAVTLMGRLGKGPAIDSVIDQQSLAVIAGEIHAANFWNRVHEEIWLLG